MMEDQVLVHHGIKGQEWGDRRYQNEDGSLTPLGRIHYGVGEARDKSRIKLKEEKAKMKNEIRIAKAKAKAAAYKAKAEAKAYKIKKRADTEAERDRIKAEKEVEKSRIEAEREKARDISRENREIAREENQTRKDLAEIDANKQKNNIKTGVMAAAGVLAAVGLGYLIYKKASGNGIKDAIDTTERAVTKAKSAVEKVKDSPAKDFIEKTVNKKNNKNNKPKEEKETKTENKNEESKANTFERSNILRRYNTVQVNEDGSTTTKTKMFRPNYKAKTIEKRYRESEAINDKNKASNRKTKYVVNPKGEYYKVIKNSDGTTTDTRSTPTSEANKKMSRNFRDFYNLIYSKRTKHSEDHEGLILIHSDEIYHFGTKGMHWGVRRWQYEDGTLTPEGKLHYGKIRDKLESKVGSANSLANSMTETMTKTVVNRIATNTASTIMAGAAGGFTTGSILGAVAGLSVAGLFVLSKKLNERKLNKINKMLEENENKSADEFIKEHNLEEDYKNSKEYRQKEGMGQTDEENKQWYVDHAKEGMKNDEKIKQHGSYRIDKEDESEASRKTKENIESGKYNKQIIDKVADDGYERYKDNTEATGNNPISKEEFKKIITKEGVGGGYITKDGSAVVEVGDGNLLGGHSFSVEILPNGKVAYVSLHG